MGFKFKRIDLTAGSTDLPTGDTDALRRSRSEIILTKCVEAIISCNCGWQLDTAHNASISNFANVPVRNDALTYPGLFLINTTSGCKMFIAYFGGSQNAYSCIKDFGAPGSGQLSVDLYPYSQSYIGGLCVSIIPGESTSTFGSVFNTSFLPNDATRIIGTTVYWQSSDSSTTFGCIPTSGYVYSWGLFVNPYCIAVSCTKGDGTKGTLGIPTYAAGRIVGIIGHSEDNAANSKFGVLFFRLGTSNYSQCEGLCDLVGQTYSCFDGTTPFVVGRGLNSQRIWEENCASICDANGHWIKGENLNNVVVNGCFYTQDIHSTSNHLFSKSGEVRWSPFAVAAPTTDISNYYVVPGDCFKGFVDTDLFRSATVSSYGTTFDNGKFISLDANTAFLIGWDPSNDSLT